MAKVLKLEGKLGPFGKLGRAIQDEHSQDKFHSLSLGFLIFNKLIEKFHSVFTHYLQVVTTADSASGITDFSDSNPNSAIGFKLFLQSLDSDSSLSIKHFLISNEITIWFLNTEEKAAADFTPGLRN